MSEVQVRALQLQQLEEVLRLLQGLQPSADLDRDQLTSLAIFLLPAKCAKDQAIVKQGDPIEDMYLIQEGKSAYLNSVLSDS